jgi:hypothetical protein
MNFVSIKNTLNELQKVIAQLAPEDYSKPVDHLSGSTIGEHSRHIIELFQCAVNAYDDGLLNYDNRNRNLLIQANKEHALAAIESLIHTLEKPNKTLLLEQNISQENIQIETNYHREMIYNLEHCIHHQALIKVAVLQIHYIEVTDSFGVAPSTIEYRKQCAQ